jgi:hypothetical protein
VPRLTKLAILFSVTTALASSVTDAGALEPHKDQRQLAQATVDEASDEAEAHFRDVRWGMSPEEVKQREESEPAVEEGVLLFVDERIAGLDALLLYQFADNKLVESGYMFTEAHTNNNRFLSDFERVGEALTQKYGEPDEEYEHWENDLFRDQPESKGLAVAMGHLTMSALWELEETRILHSMRGDQFEIYHIVNYRSRELADLREEKEEREMLEGL